MLSQFNNFHKVTRFLLVIKTEGEFREAEDRDGSLSHILRLVSYIYKLLIAIHHLGNLPKNLVDFPDAMDRFKLALLFLKVSYRKRLVQINFNSCIDFFLILVVSSS